MNTYALAGIIMEEVHMQRVKMQITFFMYVSPSFVFLS